MSIVLILLIFHLTLSHADGQYPQVSWTPVSWSPVSHVSSLRSESTLTEQWPVMLDPVLRYECVSLSRGHQCLRLVEMFSVREGQLWTLPLHLCCAWEWCILTVRE